MDEAMIADIAATLDGDEHDGVWPSHVEVTTAFLIASTQWRLVASASGRILTHGLDYAGARAGIECAGITITPELWSDLRVMEIAACAALNETDG